MSASDGQHSKPTIPGALQHGPQMANRRLKRASRLRMRFSAASSSTARTGGRKSVQFGLGGSRARHSHQPAASAQRTASPSRHRELTDLVWLMLTRPTPYPATPLPILEVVATEATGAADKHTPLSLAGHLLEGLRCGTTRATEIAGQTRSKRPPYKGLAEVTQCVVRLLELLRDSDLQWSAMAALHSNSTGDHEWIDEGLPLVTTKLARSPAPLLLEAWDMDAATQTLLDLVRLLESLVLGECLLSANSPPKKGSEVTLPTLVLQLAGQLLQRNVPGVLEAMLPGLSLFDLGHRLQVLQLMQQHLTHSDVDIALTDSDHQLQFTYTTALHALVAMLAERSGAATDAIIERGHALLGQLVQRCPSVLLTALFNLATEHSTATVRMYALSLLSRYWPVTIGHHRLTTLTDSYATAPAANATATTSACQLHESLPVVASAMVHSNLPICWQCGGSISADSICGGCAGCGGLVHAHCLTQQSHRLRHYPYVDSVNQHRLATPLLSYIDASTATTATATGHNWRVCHLFLLVQCCECRMPIWGTRRQGVQCSRCGRFAHHSCRASAHTHLNCQETVGAEQFVMQSSTEEQRLALRQYYTIAAEYRAEHGHPCEGSVWRDTLTLQRALLQAGLDGATISMDSRTSAALFQAMDEMIAQLPDVQPWTEQLANLALSMQQSRCGPPDRLDIWPIYKPVAATASDWLDWLQMDQHCSNEGGRLMLQRMQEQGWLLPTTTTAATTTTTSAAEEEASAYSLVLVPNDPQHSSLINVIEACLANIHLGLNELGLLLLARYVSAPFTIQQQQRLMRAVIAWVCDEPVRLERLHRDYTSLNKQRYGLGLPAEATSNGASDGRAASMGANAYVQMRLSLCRTHAVHWMQRQISALDRSACCSLISDSIDAWCHQLELPAQSGSSTELRTLCPISLKRYSGRLEMLIRLRHHELIPSNIFDHLFVMWAERATSSLTCEVIASLHLEEVSAVQRILGMDRHRRASGSIGNLLLSSVTGHDSKHGLLIGDTESILYEGTLTAILARLICLQLCGAILPTNILLWLKQQLEQLDSLSLADAFHSIILLWRHLHTAADSEYVVLLQELLPSLIQLLHQHTIGQLRTLNQQTTASVDVCEQYVWQGILALVLCACGCPPRQVAKLEFLPLVHGKRVNKRETPIEQLTATLQLTDRTPLIQPLLDALHLTRLDINYATLHATHTLILHGQRISHLDNFLRGIQPKLLPRVWTAIPQRILTPALPVLLALIKAEPAYAATFFGGQFQSGCDRYQSLDNACAVFLKLSRQHGQISDEDIAYPGSIVNHIVDCLWDAEATVASKATSWLTSLDELQRTTLLDSWYGYYKLASTTEKHAVVLRMIRLGNSMPAWPGKSDWSLPHIILLTTGDSDVLDETLEDQSRAEEAHMDAQPTAYQSSPEDDLSISLLRLAFSMLAHKVPIPAVDMCTLKYLVLLQMGFRDCFVRRRHQEVQFGPLVYQPANLRQRAALAICIGGMNRLLDIYMITRTDEPIKETGLVEESEVMGAEFIDILLRLYRSNINLALLDDTLLRCWIEAATVLVYKCDLQDEKRVEDMAEIVAQLAMALSGPMATDHQILVIATLTLLLKRAPQIIAAALWRVIQAVGAVLTRLRHHPRTILYSKARHFLAHTLCRFSESGIFLLIFKNSPAPGHAVLDAALRLKEHELDMVYMLKTVIADIERHPPEPSHSPYPLREQPVHDVFQRIFATKRLDSLGISTVVYNMCRYIRVTYPLPFSDDLLTAFIRFQSQLIRQASNWDPTAFDIDPVLSVCAIVLCEHPSRFEELLSATLALFRFALQRFSVSRDTMLALIAAFDEAVHTYTTATITGMAGIAVSTPSLHNWLHNHINPMTHALLGELKQRCSSGSGMLTVTAVSCVELMLLDLSGHAVEASAGVFGSEELANIAVSISRYLMSPMAKRSEDAAFHATAARFLMACVANNLVPMKLLLPTEEGSVALLQAMSWYAITILSMENPSLYRTLLHAGSLLLAQSLTQLLVGESGGEEGEEEVESIGASGDGELSAATISLCYLAIKVHALLCRQLTSLLAVMNVQNEDEQAFWHIVWPALKRQLLIQFTPIVQYRSDVERLWRGFIDMVAFLQRTHSQALDMHGEEWQQFIDNFIVQQREQVGAVDAKVSETRRGFDDRPPELAATLQLERLLTTLTELTERLDTPTMILSATTVGRRRLGSGGGSAGLSSSATMPALIRSRTQPPPQSYNHASTTNIGKSSSERTPLGSVFPALVRR